MVNVKVIANRFIELARDADEPLNNRKLNGLLFFAQEICRRRIGVDLFSDEIEDWGRDGGGPIVWAIYMRYRKYGIDHILRPEARYPTKQIPAFHESVIRETWQRYGGFTGTKLADIARKRLLNREG